ncbi:MAG: isoprenylcysteine carboxylmethyltransferase family protein [Candidatus Omnitrophica bacterium]|nr:isoprenylcysteine carboxylmethyltransferase family protein [Candidatus Omnitrophota bacterium]MBU1995632.1 isoprenylcysteine carboxylmethyltransferase family protein [Candidatus Omnitrophota bacterium]MBU4332837.1 isoprenylcysteine carboxylmethyltransferase family protein [Candidatus Omnitrophota bacterium]
MLKNLQILLNSPLGLLELFIVFIISSCVFVLFVSILINFVESRSCNKPKKEKKSIVETGTMTLFFFVFYALIRFKIGVLALDNISIRLFFIVIGLFMILAGCYVNVKGRLVLGKNWANQIKIYDDHTLVNADVFSLVRHPLYSSLMMMFYGATLVYLNYAAFLANTFIFIPFMYYRAKQEEELLGNQFEDYAKYKEQTGMFFPKDLNRKV